MRFIAFVAGLLLAVTAGFVFASGVIPGVPSRDDRPAKDAATRWGNVSVGPVPADSGLRIVIYDAFSAEQRTAFEVVLDGPGQLDPRVRVDAETGRVTDDTLSAVMPDAATAVIKSIRTGLGSPDAWPYVGHPRGLVTATYGSIEYMVPQADSGIRVRERIAGYCAVEPCTGDWLEVLTIDSYLRVDAETGMRRREQSVAGSPDALAFQRFIDEVRVRPDHETPVGDQP